MFSLTQDDQSSDDELDFNPASGKGLSGIFDPKEDERRGSLNDRKKNLTYQAPRQASSTATKSSVSTIYHNKEEKEEINQELVGGFEPMSNIHPGVKMATAVKAFKVENNSYKQLGKLGLAIIGNKESNFYQLLLYRGKQLPVAVANITPNLNIAVQEANNNYISLTDQKSNTWILGFESQDVMINFVKKTLLCKTVFRNVGVIMNDVCHGSGNSVSVGDSVEVTVNSWRVENQSIGSMLDTLTGRKVKLPQPGTYSPSHRQAWQQYLEGMRKGGRRFLILPPDDGRPGGLAVDIQVTRTKTQPNNANPQETKMPTESDGSREILIQRVGNLQPASDLNNSKKESSTELPELEEVSPSDGSEKARHASSESRGDPRHLPKDSTNGRSPRHVGQDAVHTLSGSVESVRSAVSSQQQQIQMYTQGIDTSSLVGRQEWNMLLSENRMANTELRMNMSRISDKLDDLLKAGVNTSGALNQERDSSVRGNSEKLETIKQQLDIIRGQTKELAVSVQRLESRGAGQSNRRHSAEIQAEKLKKLEMVLREKESQLNEISNTALLKERLKEAEMELERLNRVSRQQMFQEIRKMINSTGKFLLNQFHKDGTYTGEEVLFTITDILHSVAEHVTEKYDTRSESHSADEQELRQVPIHIERQPGQDDSSVEDDISRSYSSY